MSPREQLTSQFFSEAACPRKGQQNRPPLRGVGVRVIQYLRAEFPTPATPRVIASAIRASHEAVKKFLQRNEGTRVVRMEARGYWRARADMALLRRIGIDPLKVHAVQVTVSPRRGSPPLFGGQRDKRTEFHGRFVTVQPEGVGAALVSVRASKQPFDVPEFCELVAWLEGIAGPGGSVRLRSFDLNLDVEDHRLRMKGVQSTELGDFRSALVKVYNKQVVAATRLEACLHRVDLDASEAARILHQITAAPAYAPFEPQPPDLFDPGFA